MEAAGLKEKAQAPSSGAANRVVQYKNRVLLPPKGEKPERPGIKGKHLERDCRRFVEKRVRFCYTVFNLWGRSVMRMKTAFVNCTLLSGTKDMEPQAGMAVVVENGKITSVEKAAGAYEGCEVVDLGGRYLMPGLINLHLHLPSTGAPKKKETDAAKLASFLMSNPITRALARSVCEKAAKTELLSGVTTIRTVGGLDGVDSAIRDRIKAGKTVGPRMLVSDLAVTVPGGHMAGSVAAVAQSEEECRALVRKIAQGKPDLIKLMITGGVLDAKVKGEPGVLRMPPELVRAACEEAHKLGYQVAAHVESSEGVRVALENGVDTIEHGAPLDEALVELFKQRGAAHVCTISPAVPLAMMDPEVVGSTELTQYNGNVVFEGIVSCAKTALANDIPVGLGTDAGCPFTTHYDMWRELQYFHKYVGVSRAFALYTATLKNAEILGIQNETGSVEAGKSADLLITGGNPLEDLTCLRAPYMVVMAGRVIAQPQVKKYPLVERELDKFL